MKKKVEDDKTLSSLKDNRFLYLWKPGGCYLKTDAHDSFSFGFTNVTKPHVERLCMISLHGRYIV